ncbi:ParB/RepB/Spo0J family partition protein [Streptomyces sp. NPDC048430]|uniref:ParB/RepB/Spo0J family partition protein n=1 Tax=Streptomyces sp. NPDC048430 TaxID=3155388 RepID=UPI0034390A7F
MSSKAQKLGVGASFGQAKGGVSARRAAIDATTTAPTEGAPPPLKLPLNAISLNPDNPRSELGDLTDLGASLRDHGQKTAISIMGRFAYLEGNPHREKDLEEDTKYVVIDGNSRLAAAREAGLSEIKVMLDDDLGSNPDEILESALVANVHRQDLAPLDEARALQQLLKIHQTQEALAARLHRSQGWVSQRLALLGLTQELKERLQSGKEPASLLRRVGGKKPEEQEAHLQRLKDAQQMATRGRPASPPATPAPAPPAQEYYDVMNDASSNSDEDGAPERAKDQPEAATPPSDESPSASTSDASQGAAVQQLPTHDWESLADIVIAELPVETRHSLTKRLQSVMESEVV